MVLGRGLGRSPGRAGVGVDAHVFPPVATLLSVASPVSLHGLGGGSVGFGPDKQQVVRKVFNCVQNYTEILCNTDFCQKYVQS